MEAGESLGKTNDNSVSACGESLRTLIVGGKEVLVEANTILGSLNALGFRLNLVGVVYAGSGDLSAHAEADKAFPILRDYRKVIAEDTVDLIIMTSDDYELRKDLIKSISPSTRFMDSFALRLLHALKNLAGKLGATEEKLKSVELVKEVIMQGSEVSM